MHEAPSSTQVSHSTPWSPCKVPSGHEAPSHQPSTWHHLHVLLTCWGAGSMGSRVPQSPQNAFSPFAPAGAVGQDPRLRVRLQGAQQPPAGPPVHAPPSDTFGVQDCASYPLPPRPPASGQSRGPEQDGPRSPPEVAGVLSVSLPLSSPRGVPADACSHPPHPTPPFLELGLAPFPRRGN